MNTLTLKHANHMIDAAINEGRKLHLKPLCVLVLDAGGHLIAAQRQDQAAILRFDIAFAKAYGALGMGMGSRGLASMAKDIPDFISGATNASKGRLVPAPGGVLILAEKQGVILGAVGVSGDTSDNDERTAITGIESVNFIPKVD